MGPGPGLSCDITLNSALPPELRARYQNPSVIRRILRDAKTIAIVGLSAQPQKASHFVATYLQYEGYRIVPVNPSYDEVLGQTCYPDLASIPRDVEIDLVDVFRPAAECPEVARQAAAIGAGALWLQLRIVSEEAAAIAREAGVDVVMDKCVKMEHGRYNGSLHWVGMNTEIITARKARRWF